MMLRGFITILIVMLLFACAPAKIIIEPNTMRMEPKAGQLERDSKKSSVPDNILAVKLFDAAYDYFAEGLLEEALLYFNTLVERFPKDIHVSDSLYNAGLIYHKQAKYQAALEKYLQVVKTNYNNKDVLDAHFRLLACMHELKLWQETLDRVQMIKTGWPIIEADDRVELEVRKGVALFGLGEIEESKVQLLSAWQDYEIGLRKDEVINEFPGALAAYTLAMIERKSFMVVKLVLAEKKQMMLVLEKKAQYLQNAQDWLMKCIAQDNAYWATAAGNQIGRLYHDFYEQIRNVEIPANLKGNIEESSMYKCMLLDMVKVLLKKAMRIYGRTIDMGQRLRVRNRWTDKTKEDLQKVEKLYLEDIKRCEGVLPSEEVLEEIRQNNHHSGGESLTNE